jgi:hypothetical protein
MTDHTADRIRLAELMGWKWELHTFTKTGAWIRPDGSEVGRFSLRNKISFDPWTDANHDYQVLEWMRDHRWSHSHEYRWMDFVGFVLDAWNARQDNLAYQKGDYADSALKAHDFTQEEK